MSDKTEPTSKLRRRPVVEKSSPAQSSQNYTHRGKTWSDMKEDTAMENWATVTNKMMARTLSRAQLAERILKYSREAAKEMKDKKVMAEYVVVTPAAELKKAASRAKTPGPKKMVRIMTGDPEECGSESPEEVMG